MRTMRVKHRSHKFVLHKFFIVPYVTMRKMLERINKKLHKLIESPILTNSHEFVVHKNVALRYLIEMWSFLCNC